MADKFVRNITDTNTGGNKLNKNNEPTEPLYTNIQNDILSDDEDVYIRNQNEYVCLTDNVKEVETTNNIIGTENTDKNTVELQPQVATKTDAETGTSNGKIMTPLQTKNAIDYNNENVIPGLVKEHETETEIVSKSDNLTVTRKSKNNFELEVEQNADLSNIELYLNVNRKEEINSNFSLSFPLINNLQTLVNNVVNVILSRSGADTSQPIMETIPEDYIIFNVFGKVPYISIKRKYKTGIKDEYIYINIEITNGNIITLGLIHNVFL